MTTLTTCQMYEMCKEIHGRCASKYALYAVACDQCDMFKMYCKGWNDAVKAIEEEKKHGLCKKDAKEGT